MSKQAIERMMQDHAEAIRRNEYPISHSTICDILADLAAEKITEAEALAILQQNAEQVGYAPKRTALYQQAIADLQAMQAAEQQQ